MLEKKVEDLFPYHVLEPLRLSFQEIQVATEAAIMILRIDDVIAAKGNTNGHVGRDEIEDY